MTYKQRRAAALRRPRGTPEDYARIIAEAQSRRPQPETEALERARENLYEAELRSESEARLAGLRARVRQAERNLQERTAP